MSTASTASACRMNLRHSRIPKPFPVDGRVCTSEHTQPIGKSTACLSCHFPGPPLRAECGCHHGHDTVHEIGGSVSFPAIGAHRVLSYVSPSPSKISGRPATIAACTRR